MFKEEIISALAKKTKLRKEEIENLIEIPPDSKLGDYAFPCFILSKHFKKSPDKIAEQLKNDIQIGDIEKVEARGPYLNFFTDKKKLADKIIRINANFGKINIGKRKKIAIDFSAPNIGKPMHIGHIRSTVIGDSLVRTYWFLGYSPVGINYLGDIGLHIGKLIVAYELWVDKTKLKKDPVQELLRLYVRFCSKEKEISRERYIEEDRKVVFDDEEEFQDNEWTQKAKEKLKLLELGDKKTEKIWKDIRKASGKAFDKIYNMLNIKFTETTGQSQFTKKGRSMVTDALKKGMARKEPDGAVYIELNGNKKYISRSNETASYITYDLGAAVERFKKYKFEKMIYVTDFRQKSHFESLFSILKIMKYDFADKLIHLPFGTVKFEKEIIATREGKIILLEDVLEKTIKKASEEIKKRKTKGDPEKVGVAAVKYLILKNEPIKDVQFSWELLNFDGNTGPYLQYSYARASSIIRKAGKFNKSKIKTGDLKEEEISLLKKISDFPEIVEKTGIRMNPGLIANYSFELAKVFNEFYHNCRVVGDKKESFRLRLVDSFRTTLKNALYLLGIETMEEM